MKEFTVEELSQHCKPDDLWVAIRGKVYSISAFLQDHPGGPEILLEQAGIYSSTRWRQFVGLDATAAFEDIGHSDVAHELLKEYCIGVLADKGGFEDEPKTCCLSSNCNMSGLWYGL